MRLKKVTAILLIGIHLLTTTELSEFMKLPALVEHFIEHRTLNNDVTLLSFLDMHYNHGDVKDADYQKDMQLPFKSHDGCINLSILIAIPHKETCLDHPQIFQKNEHSSMYHSFASSELKSTIWQPPKSC